MGHRRWTCGLITAVILGLSGSPTVQAQTPKKSAIQAACTRPDAVFKVGESATFKVESEVEGEATYRLTEDGFKTLKEGKLTLEKGKPVEVSGTLDKPGFLQFRVTLGKEDTLAAAAFEPTKIAPTTKMPAGFDSFWDAQKKEL